MLKKLEKIQKLKDEIDDEMWITFYRYIKLSKINFSSPRFWVVETEDKCVTFVGEDGCMGCYEPMTLSIDFSFFKNTKESLEELAQEIKDKEKRQIELKRKIQEKEEKKELERLTKKYKT